MVQATWVQKRRGLPKGKPLGELAAGYILGVTGNIYNLCSELSLLTQGVKISIPSEDWGVGAKYFRPHHHMTKYVCVFQAFHNACGF
jgi:hypothetical protein